MESAHPSSSGGTIPRAPSALPRFRWAAWLSTGCGAGYLPVMPGTYGSAEGLLVYLGLAWVFHDAPNGVWWLCAAVLLLTAASLWIISRALPHFSSDDPSAIVIDEVAGQCITLLGVALAHPSLTPGWLALGLGFFLFRAFDALKPYPIWKLGHLKGAAGVLADDVGAAMVAGAILFGAGRMGWV
ncbi:MAG TPA: phosphatidylglycerophosphatase A [Terriglobia bacterium]|nr:phosphatidylglycerophosphatase A [Terriglobia bacterium]